MNLKRINKLGKNLLLLCLICTFVFSGSKQVKSMGDTEPFIGQIALFPYNFAPRGWMECSGQALSLSQNTALYSVIGNTYGGNYTYFNLPNLTDASPISGLKYYICVQGIFPSRDNDFVYEKAIGEVGLFVNTCIPLGWLPCDGATYNKADYEELFVRIGYQFGGSGNTFKVPDLRGTEPNEKMKYYISTTGYFNPGPEMLMGSVNLYAYNTNVTDSNNVSLCDGKLINNNENQALFSLLGVTFGGNGTTNFAIPDLRGAAPAPGMNYSIAKWGLYPSRP